MTNPEQPRYSLTPEQQAEIEALIALPDDQIDTSDIPEITDFTGFQRGLFYQRGTDHFSMKKFTEGISSSIEKFIEGGEELRKTMTNPRYSMLIQWSNEDNAFLVILPEWQNEIQDIFAHGDTYEEAAKNGRECLEFLVKCGKEAGENLPEPDVHISEDEAQEIDKKWDELLASPESQAYSAKMAAELDTDREAGRLIPGGFNGRGEFTEDLEAALKALIGRARQGMMMCDQEALTAMINETLKSGDKRNESMEK